MQKILFFTLLLLLSSKLVAQKQEIDSLNLALKAKNLPDTERVDILNELAFLYSRSNQDSSSLYISRSLELAAAIDYERGLVRGKVLQGNNLTILGLTEEALSYYLEAIALGAENYPMEYIRTTNNLGELYRRKELLDSSISYFSRAKNAAETLLSNAKPVIILSNLGEVYLMKNQTDSAYFYFDTCLKNASEQNNLVGIGYGYYGLAEVAFQRDQLEQAVDLQKLSIKYRDSANHIRGKAQSFLRLGEYYFSLGNLRDAESYLKDALSLAEANRFNDLLNKTYLQLYTLYLKKEDLREAGIYLQKFEKLSDSIRSMQFASSAKQIQKSLQAEILSKENELLKTEKEIRESRERSRLITILLIIAIAAIVFYSIFKGRQKERAIKERSKENVFTQSLLALAKSLNESDFHLEKFVENLLSDSQSILRAHRASYWTHNPKTEKLLLHRLVEAPEAAHIEPIIFQENDLPKFFANFLSRRTVSFSKLSEEKDLDDAYREFFKKSGIESILNAPIHVAGNFAGFISYSMTKNQQREWTIQEHRYVGSLADLIVSAIEKNRANNLENEKAVVIEKLQKRNESLKEFNSVVSHNLREPLTQIIGLADILLKEKSDNPMENEVISRIAEASKKTDQVIRELSIVLNEQEPESKDFSQVSMKSALKEVKSLLQHDIQQLQIDFFYELECDKVCTYKPFLIDVLYHLISNSIKFRKADETLKITISSYQDDDQIALAITDNGRGMDMEKFGHKLFKMYQRFHLDTEGRGIGLYIVNNRLNTLNASVEVKSTLNQGTTFLLKFPA